MSTDSHSCPCAECSTAAPACTDGAPANIAEDIEEINRLISDHHIASQEDMGCNNSHAGCADCSALIAADVAAEVDAIKHEINHLQMHYLEYEMEIWNFHGYLTELGYDVEAERARDGVELTDEMVRVGRGYKILKSHMPPRLQYMQELDTHWKDLQLAEEERVAEEQRMGGSGVCGGSGHE